MFLPTRIQKLIDLHLAARDYTSPLTTTTDAHLGVDSTCVHETAANIMANADRDDALDTLVRKSLHYVI